MKSFSDFLVEKKKDRNRPGPQGPSEVDVQQSRSRFSAGKNKSSSPKPLTQSQIAGAWKSGAGGGKSAIGTSRKPEGPTWFGTDIKAIKAGQEAESELRQKVKDTLLKNQGGSPELQAAQSSLPTPETKVGSGAKPGTGQRYRQRRPSEPRGLTQGQLSKEADKALKDLRADARAERQVTTQRRSAVAKGPEISRRMSAAYDKNLASTADDIIKGVGAERRAETAAGNKEFKQLRYGTGRSGPTSKVRTPAQSQKWIEGVKKGYFDPTTGKPTASGIQKYTTMRAAGGIDFGKFKASGGDPRAALKGVENIVSRAASGDPRARSEVRRSYKAMTTKYSPSQTKSTPAPSKPTPPPSQVIAQTQQTGRIEASKASSKSGGASSGPSKAGGVLTPTKTKAPELNLAKGPAPTKAPTPTAATFTPGKTKVGTGLYTPPIKAPTPTKPVTVAAPKASKPSTRSVAPRVSTSTTNAAASVKSFRTMARVGGLFATGLTVKNVRDQALASGAGRRRADLEGLAAGIGGSLASTAAITAATPTGPVGQAVAGTAAFQPGADFARGIVRKLAGKPGDAVTKKSVLKNIKSTYREVVSKDIRKQVPGQVKQGFTTFYNKAVPFANKLYKGYRRFERVSDLTGENNK